MPRKCRLNVPGAVNHIMSRCLRSEQLFNDDNDRTFFVNLLDKSLRLAGCRCYAWAILNNHYHIVVRTGGRELWELMKPLNCGYAAYHKYKYGRSGPLFRDRFKSIVTQDQKYVEELIRYVHLNPVRAGICKNFDSLDTYPWCGHGALMGTVQIGFQDTRTVLKRFSNVVEDARVRYRTFLQDGLARDMSENGLWKRIRNSNEGVEAGRKPECWVIGDQTFVRKAITDAEAVRLRVNRSKREGVTLGVLADEIANRQGITADLLRRRCRGGIASNARKLLAYYAAKEYGFSLKDVGQYAGVGLAAASKLARAGREIVSTTNVVLKLIN